MGGVVRRNLPEAAEALLALRGLGSEAPAVRAELPGEIQSHLPHPYRGRYTHSCSEQTEKLFETCIGCNTGRQN